MTRKTSRKGKTFGIENNTLLIGGGAAALAYWLFAMGGKDQLAGMFGGFGGQQTNTNNQYGY